MMMMNMRKIMLLLLLLMMRRSRRRKNLPPPPHRTVIKKTNFTIQINIFALRHFSPRNSRFRQQTNEPQWWIATHLTIIVLYIVLYTVEKSQLVSMMDRYMNNYTATQYILLHIRLRSTIMQIYEYTNIGIHRIYECANIRIHRIYEYTNPEHKEYTYTQTQNIQKIQIRKHTNTQNILIHKPKIHRKYETYKYTEYTNTQTQNTQKI